MSNQSDILQVIEAFLRRTGMGPSYFGKVAVGNSELVTRLRAGRDIRTSTDRKIRDFVAQASSEAAE